MKCKSSKYRIVSLKPRDAAGSSTTSGSVALPVEEDGDAEMVDALENLPPTTGGAEDVELGLDAATAAASAEPGASSGGARSEPWTPEAFHERLCVTELDSIDDVEKYYSEQFHVLADECGVLLLLYTVLLTKVSHFRSTSLVRFLRSGFLTGS